jgi:predicted ATPase/class 3 adenylate cyclase
MDHTADQALDRIGGEGRGVGRRIIRPMTGDLRAPARPDLPTGTVTFLFTDIEGSTRLLDRLGDRYPRILEEHQKILRAAFAPRGGVEVSTEGDSFFVVFPSAPQAVAAALEAQRALASHPWGEDAEVRVRMGLHTGEGVFGADNYVGADVHRAARIASAGHGGQVVVSASTEALVQPSAPEGATFRDLGEHRLKDLPHTEHLFQVVVDDLPADFPSLRSMDVRPNNLPVQLTSFVGRRRELEAIQTAVRKSRFLTLTGPGGTGKSRLSIQAASGLLPEFEDGAFFVALAPITDPGLVVPSIAQALGLREASSDRPPIEGLIDHLREKEVLLVLDNFEQVLDAAGEVGQLLTATERVRVLATSREPLGLHGEREYPVPPMGLPDPGHLPSPDRMSQYESVALFIERATAVKPGFTVTNENAPAIAEICARLDGLPLAIELAAARVKILDPQAMLSRLEHSLMFLTRGARDVPARQQTLRDAIAWSFDLLDEEERRLFARLAVFAGGFSLDAAEAVTNPDGELAMDTLDGVASLTNKSLLRQMESEPGEPAFFMLETIREFAAERLAASPDLEEVARRHASFFLELAERFGPELTGPNQIHWLDRFTAEHDNFRAALTWTESADDLDTALRLGGSLWRFWQMRGHLREGRERLDRLLAFPSGSASKEARAVALEGAGGVAYWMADMSVARRYYEECLAIRRELGEPRAIAEALYNLGFSISYEDRTQLNAEAARTVFEEALAMFRQLGDQGAIARALWAIGNARYIAGDYEGAMEPLEEALEIQRRLGNRFDVAWSLFMQGLSLLNRGKTESVEAALGEALSILVEAKDTSGLPLVLWGFSALSILQGDGPRAVRLAAAAAAVEETSGSGLIGVQEEFAQWETRRRALVTPEEHDRRWQEGLGMTTDEAVAYALNPEAEQPTTDAPDRPDAPGSGWTGTTG